MGSIAKLSLGSQLASTTGKNMRGTSTRTDPSRVQAMAHIVSKRQISGDGLAKQCENDE